MVLWSDQATRAYGQISAKGGPNGGDGGFVETSSRGYLDVTQTPDLTAPLGSGGLWLLDPSNITVQATTGTLDGLTPNFVANTDGSTVSNTAIQTALNGGSNVLLATNNGSGTELGDITVGVPITYAGTGELALLANNNVAVNAAIANSSTGNVRLVAGWDGASTTTPVSTAGTGLVTVAANVTTGGQTFIQSGNGATFSSGAVTINGGYAPGTGAFYNHDNTASYWRHTASGSTRSAVGLPLTMSCFLTKTVPFSYRKTNRINRHQYPPEP